MSTESLRFDSNVETIDVDGEGGTVSRLTNTQVRLLGAGSAALIGAVIALVARLA